MTTILAFTAINLVAAAIASRADTANRYGSDS